MEQLEKVPQLQSICIISKAGTLLFSSEIEGGSRNLRLVAALFRVVQTVAVRSVGTSMSYLMLDGTGITIATDKDVELRVIIFHDVNYQRELAACIAKEILHTFLARFEKSAIDSGNDTFNFRRFNSAIGQAIRGASSRLFQSVIDKLRGAVQFAVVFNEGDALFTYPFNASHISVAANLQQLQFSLQEMSTVADDTPNQLIIDCEQYVSHFVLFGSATVVLQLRKEYYSSDVVKEVNKTILMLDLCFRTAEGFSR